jgi:pimeloyl-ACP methyl ester carboxylesterase
VLSQGSPLTTENAMTQSNEASVTRRGVLASATLGASAAVLGEMQAMAQTSAHKTFVLVHGAWHGGWCWRRVSDLLEKKGHKVFAPTMTGLGERSHLMSKDVVLDTHIADIVNVIRWEDLAGICLVAHSYGGFPVSGALEQVLDRVSSVIYLDAFVPEDGQRGLDVASDFSRKGTLEAITKGEASRPPPKAETFHVNEKDRAWVDSKLTAQPVGVALAPIKLTGAREKVAKKTYIRAPVYPQPAFDKYYAAKKADASWRTYEVDGGHDVMVDRPERLVEILLEAS